eukprot:5466372-Prymnesium_polylepis.1
MKLPHFVKAPSLSLIPTIQALCGRHLQRGPNSEVVMPSECVISREQFIPRDRSISAPAETTSSENVRAR